MKAKEKTGVHWTLTSQLDDLNFADDICLLFQSLHHMQLETDKLGIGVQKVGLVKTEINQRHANQQP